jgi:hypothetical protein
LAKDFKQLEQSAGSVSADSQLLALKQKMGLLGPGQGAAGAPNARQLGAGDAEEVVHTSDVEELPDTHKP